MATMGQDALPLRFHDAEEGTGPGQQPPYRGARPLLGGPARGAARSGSALFEAGSVSGHLEEGAAT